MINVGMPRGTKFRHEFEAFRFTLLIYKGGAQTEAATNEVRA